MDLQLQDKIALVSGSTAGIGLAIATALAKEGATVAINGRNPDRVQTAIQDIQSSYPQARLIAAPADASDAKSLEAVYAKLPAIDILVNNIGIYEIKSFVETNDEEWLRFFNHNVLSGVRLCRRYLDGMLKKNWGRIIFISSESGVQISSEMIHYAMTKSAQISIARGLAELTAGSQVTVNSVLPGPTSSEGLLEFVDKVAAWQNKQPEDIKNEMFKTIRPTSLLKRFERPDEIANVVTFLCSPLASAINGAAVRADGGIIRSMI